MVNLTHVTIYLPVLLTETQAPHHSPQLHPVVRGQEAAVPSHPV